MIRSKLLGVCALLLLGATSIRAEDYHGVRVPQVEKPPTSVLSGTSTFYVDQKNPKASDANNGSKQLPWKTIAHAAKSMTPGAKVVVLPGEYNERVTVRNGGNKDHYTVFEARGEVKTQGFSLTSNYVAMIGFTFDGVKKGGYGGGAIWLAGNNVWIKGNRFLNSAQGIVPAWGKKASAIENVFVIDNHFYGCNKGLVTSGKRWLVEGNRFERLIRPAQGGTDADYSRFFGKDIIFRSNLFQGTKQSEIGRSHVDITQSFHHNNSSVDGFLFEKNMCLGMFHQALMVEARSGSHSNFIIRNNVFSGGGSWVACLMGIKNVAFVNNTIFDMDGAGVGYRAEKRGTTDEQGSTGVCKNNLFCKSRASYYHDRHSRLEHGRNLVHQSRKPGGTPSKPNILGKDPKFVNPSDILGKDGKPFTADDGLRISTQSPAWKAGENEVNIGAY